MASLSEGDRITNMWTVLKKLGEGGCGTVFEVENNEDNCKYAMKVEPTSIRRRDQLLKTEAFILKKMQFSKYVPSYLAFDRTSDFRFLVMELLGNSLHDYIHSLPNKRVSVSTTLRVGLLALEAIIDMHKIFFVHRDIKPANFAFGLGDHSRRMYLIDFGMSRSILNPPDKLRKRRATGRVLFRGTTLYCSPNMHMKKEQGRHDDLWALLYMCTEMITGRLPWSRRGRPNAAVLKVGISGKELFQGCPKKFEVLLEYYRSLSYEDRPDYDGVKDIFKNCMKARQIDDDDPFDWELGHVNVSKHPIKQKAIHSSESIDSSSRTCDDIATGTDDSLSLEVSSR
ncbi:protein kinase domain-containing protein [Ditylenchus destructor]|uniref:Protein kinase domain-containing protein n=1 Tax=Ditylenchus destructor TaxID=166010 RepID=A0AAD4R2M7_9BILA|nr:protein kinase domain-containing protein [Ditylenchus destructor]